MARYKRTDLQGAWDTRYFENSRELRRHAQELVNNSLDCSDESRPFRVKTTKQAIDELGALEFEIEKISEAEYQEGLIEYDKWWRGEDD